MLASPPTRWCADITTVPYSGTVPLCNIGYSGVGGCSQPIAIGQLMTSGWMTELGR